MILAASATQMLWGNTLLRIPYSVKGEFLRNTQYEKTGKLINSHSLRIAQHFLLGQILK